MKSFIRRDLFRMGALMIIGAVVSLALSACAGNASVQSADVLSLGGTTWYAINGSESIGGIGVSKIEFDEGGAAVVGVQIMTAEGAGSVVDLIEGLAEEDVDYVLSEDGTWEQSGQDVTLTSTNGTPTSWKIEDRDGTVVLVDASGEDSAQCFYQDFKTACDKAVELLKSE